MKTLREALFNKKNLKNYNPYGITEKDMIGDIDGFPIGIVVRMLEEQEAVGNTPDVTVFQEEVALGDCSGGFNWAGSEAGYSFWSNVLLEDDFELFYREYPEYRMYDL